MRIIALVLLCYLPKLPRLSHPRHHGVTPPPTDLVFPLLFVLTFPMIDSMKVHFKLFTTNHKTTFNVRRRGPLKTMGLGFRVYGGPMGGPQGGI